MIDEILSTHSPRVRRKREARRERILATAMELLATEGLENLTVVRLAEALDYTAGALYRYFPSKDALLAEMQRHAVVELGRDLAQAAARANDVRTTLPRSLVRLVALGSAYVDLFEGRQGGVRLINFLLADPRPLIGDDQAARTAPLLINLFAAVDALFEAAVADGVLRPGASRDRTIMLWTALQGASQLEKMRRFDAHAFAPTRIGHGMYRSLLCGWGADPDAVDRAAKLFDTEIH
jgi:AcrR family transcriptional regulator